MPNAVSADPALPVDEAAFRGLMSQFATGVCVVAAASADGAPSGITVNSFVSVSLDPMLVCWSLHNSSSQFDLWTKAETFSISILSAGQEAIAMRYAARDANTGGPADFAGAPNEVPHIGGALGYLECRLWKLVPAGDHTMILGEVTGLHRPAAGGAEAAPLLFFGSSFRKIGD